jgi:transposase-like protein
MGNTNLSLSVLDERFTDALKAAEYLESVRWPNGPVCPHCTAVTGDRNHYRLKTAKRRLWKCYACRKQFTVTVGTIFEGSHIPLNKWLLGFNLLCSSKKGMSAHQLHRMLGVTYKSAWFMAHRIRYAMQQPPFKERLQGTIEVDETYIGGKARNKHKRHGRGYERADGFNRNLGRGKDKAAVAALVQRDGNARAFHIANVTGETLHGLVLDHVDKTSRLYTDSFSSYRGLSKHYAAHESVNHTNDEWVRGDVHTNTVESYFAILKRGIDGVYHHVSEAHLHRYLVEFDFRYNTRTAVGVNDGQRTRRALEQVGGKRLTYRETSNRA